MSNKIIYHGIEYSFDDIEEIAKKECEYCEEEYRDIYVSHRKNILEIITFGESILIPFSFLWKFVRNLKIETKGIVIADNQNSYTLSDLIRIGENIGNTCVDEVKGQLYDISVKDNYVTYSYKQGNKMYNKKVFVSFLKVYKVGKYISNNFVIDVG